jgi:hypothetical protein
MAALVIAVNTNPVELNCPAGVAVRQLDVAMAPGDEPRK